ncbi:MAG: inositol monophosphatase [Lentisphaeria bacterium]|nr:inositol monophosphatase [Candidatus Neomarinimicrobiota bacterium]MCF7841773.1 inositol monophosphatase [Lentisphaeria bacterium]
MTAPDSIPLLNDIYLTTQRAAKSAGSTIRRLSGNPRKIDFKRSRDMVTNVDRAAEQTIVDIIRYKFPQHSILAEERGEIHNPESDFEWIIDPLDGTTNFVHHFPAYCVSVGVTYQGEMVAGSIYDPIRDELFHAKKGGGAFRNGQGIRVSDTPDLGKSLLATGFPYINDALFELNMRIWVSLYGQTQGLRRAGSAALDLAMVACGRLDGFWEFSLNPWDLAAGTLLVQEAGGTVTAICGKPFQVNTVPHILTGNPTIHQAMLERIVPYLEGVALERPC